MDPTDGGDGMTGSATPEDAPPVRVSAQGGEPASGWVPHPVLSLVILAMWLLLADSVHPGTVAMGALVGWTIPLFVRVFLPVRPRIHSVTTLVRFVPRFVFDVVVANFQVAALILTVGRQPRPHWLVIPLELRDPHAITVLANVISLTPGTVSSELGPERRTLLVHALDVDDPDEEVARIKTRYEQPLKEIFEC